MILQKNQHEFALFYPSLADCIRGSESYLTLTETALVHRIATVLRMQKGDSCILFDPQYHGIFTIESVSKKEITGTLYPTTANKLYTTQITYFVPVLKRDALDTALYALTELAVNTIQLVLTAKTARSFNPLEYARLQRIIIAACEQSKQFAIPTLHAPIDYHDMILKLRTTDTPTIFCDPQGTPLISVIHHILKQPIPHLYLLAGPEGDLTIQEKEALLSLKPVTSCALTPTILRAHQAISLSAGIFRSLLP